MPRLGTIESPKETPPKETAAQKRDRLAAETAAALAADGGPARRGEADEQESEPERQIRTPAGAEAPASERLPAASPPPSVALAALKLPDPASDPADQLAVCERAIHGLKVRWKAKVDAATEELVDLAGPFLCWVHEHKLYKLMLDNAGKPYRSFPKYLREQHELSERTGYRITQTIPLLRILADGGHDLPDLSARQVGVLHPVRVQHGPDAVLKVWNTAWETKKGPLPTPEELEKAKRLIGLTTRPDADAQQDLARGAVDPGKAVERASKLLVPETVREAVRKDPSRVRELYQVLGAALTEAGVDVD